MEEACPKLLDLIPKDREWVMKEQRSHGCSAEEKKLELRLGPPGEDYYNINGTNKNNSSNRDESLLSLGHFSPIAASMSYYTNNNSMKRGFMGNNNGKQTLKSNESEVMGNSNNNNNNNESQNQKFCSYMHQLPSTTTMKTHQRLPVMAKESSQTCCTKVVGLQSAEKKASSPSSANTAVPNSSQKRTAPAPVVGWPPIRSFRKNLASSSTSKPVPESQNEAPKNVSSLSTKNLVESCTKGLFVKINMDGVPIGRKVDLKAYDSYENLSSAVDELFRGLLAAQRDSSVGGIQNKPEEEKSITGILDGTGEYTLVYEDIEGDQMLVGDVPWHMFVTTVKRLRVLKSSELSALSLGNKQGKMKD